MKKAYHNRGCALEIHFAGSFIAFIVGGQVAVEAA